MNSKEVIEEYGNEILNNSNMIKSKEYMQHGTTSVFDHSLNVTMMCLKIVNILKINIDTKSLIRGALLHDYFLYDWHVKDETHQLHGFKHAKIALNNACKEFELNEIEKNMIYTHMFPLNLRIPKYKESIILCIADKICASKEVLEVSLEKLKLIYNQI